MFDIENGLGISLHVVIVPLVDVGITQLICVLVAVYL